MKIIGRYLFIAFFGLVNLPANAQHQGYIYGSIVLKNRDTYTGQIQWSGGQVLWSDILLVSKQKTTHLKYLSRYQLENLSQSNKSSVLDWQFMNLWKDKYPEKKSEIVCRFGDIAIIHVTGENEAQIYYKNGSKIRVATDEQEGRHLGKDIVLNGHNGKVLTLKWSDISTIRFSSTPADIPALHSKPLYGTVITTNGALTGYIQWDKVKYLEEHKLNGGNERSARPQYSFGQLKSIRKSSNGVLVTLISGEEVALPSSSLSGSLNRGIVVMHPVWGRAVVSWNAFQAVHFSALPADLGYDSYPAPKKIYAIVALKNKREIYKGNAVFDLDEEWNYDLLEGQSKGIQYQIPFKHITKVSPIHQHQSKVTLADNNTLILSGHKDVNSNNWGMLVWMANSKNKYIPWNLIKEVDLR